MKKIVIYTLLSFYVLAQLRPLAVIVNDVLAHTFFRVQHMATIHYENGKYHLHTELETIADEDTGNDKTNPPAKENNLKETPQTIIHSMAFVSLTEVKVKIDFTHYLQSHPGYTILPARPPEILTGKTV